MTLQIQEIGLGIEIADELLNSIVDLSKTHYQKEFGGFLIGYYTDRDTCLYITDIILPSNFRGSKYCFKRSSRGIEKRLRTFYQENPKKVYVGEWHTHPDGGTVPSTIDISALKAIAENMDGGLTNPVLLIVGLNNDAADFGFYVWFKNNLYSYE